MDKNKIHTLLSAILVAKIVEITKHPDADKLLIVQVDIGTSENIQIVTGADNVQVGDYVPFLGVGEIVPGLLISEGKEFKLEKRALRGVMSNGMILSGDEVGINKDHTGIVVLQEMSDENIGKSIVEVWNGVVEEVARFNKVVEKTPELLERLDIIKSIAKDGGEIVGEDELAALLSSGEKLYTYDGFEPSGQMHIAQGIIRAINTNKMIAAGFTFRMWVADWFGYINNKMGGDLEKIKIVGAYFIEIWRASGMDLENVEFLWTSDLTSDSEYWSTVMKVAKSLTLNRAIKTTEIMGRSESDNLSAAQILYPCMQIADIFYVMKAQVTQLGLDQRKANVIAREVGPELGFWKPIIVSHGMLQGLQTPAPKDIDAQTRAISMKMSKSKPDTAIFMTDTREDIERKIKKAYCPEGEILDNPILAYCKQIIFESKWLKRVTPLLKDGIFEVNRDEKFGGNVSYASYDELEADYLAKKLFPLDLKNAVIEYLDQLIDPVRKHFETDSKAKELLEKVKSFQVTR